eukprot:CAMPEP_0177624916 /NCGR_PEP_ID=MMETSP0419_2-20121207/29784_1 /TAXON_ID=582737 /ORGANISM="Tetraselmis sp., Strain GSL018" /LENGTH=235 /DNA_ID=CAMNT_0019125753 /DNA_START=184 /DNA_END=888 /DNA_ORIENTATION=-
MAAEGDEHIDQPRESLLDVVQEKLKKQGKSSQTLVARVIYVAKLTGRETSCAGAQEFVEKVLKSKTLGASSTEHTGLLMVYPTCCLHILEARTGTIMDLLREIQKSAPTESHVKSTVVISCTEDIPARAYSEWYATFVDTLSKVEHVDGVDSTGAVNAASTINLSMINLGKMLSSVASEAELEGALKSLQTFHSDLPTPENILSMVSTEDCPTLDEFLEIFDEPINIDLDSDKVW